MDRVKPKNDLRFICDVSNLVGLIVLKIKEDYKNIDINSIKKNSELIFYIMRLIDAGAIDDRIISKKLINKLDKNKLVMDIFEALYGKLSPEDIADIEDKISLAINHKIVQRRNFFFRFLNGVYRRLSAYFIV